MSESIRKKTVANVGWNSLGNILVQGFQFTLTIIIARQLAPSTYGLIAMIAIFIDLAKTFVESGFGFALVQKQDRNSVDYSTVFISNIFLSIVFYLILWVISPYIARFFNEPILSLIIKWIGLSVIINSFVIVHRTYLQINHNFKIQTIITILSVLISGALGLLLAYSGHGIWALIIQALSYSIIESSLFWFNSKLKIDLYFSYNSFKQISQSGIRILAASLINTIYNNIHGLVIGRVYSATDLGFFSRANTFSQFVNMKIGTVIASSTFPILCEYQDNKTLLKDYYMKLTSFTMYITIPLNVIIAVLARPIVLVLLTDKWAISANYMIILSFAFVWFPLRNISSNFLIASGRADLNMRSEMVVKLIGIIILIITLPFGIRSLCWGLLLFGLLDVVVLFNSFKQVFHTSISELFGNIFPIFIIGFAMSLIVYLVSIMFASSLLQILFGSIIGLAVYITLSKLFGIKELGILLNLIFKLTRKHEQEGI
jgi:O-antigen/teichoic acid export membrane protein